jgi:uncharacterized membrane protein YfcA
MQLLRRRTPRRILFAPENRVMVLLMLGLLVGTVLGLTGAGGGILAVPALVFGLGWNMQQAAPVALIAVAAGAWIGAIEGLRKRLVRYRGALLMATTGTLLTPVGLRLAKVLPHAWLVALFAMVMLLAALRMLRFERESMELHPQFSAVINPVTGRFRWTWRTSALLGLIGATTGFAAGLLGVGGGVVMVPLLRRYSDVSMRGIVATSLLVTAIVSTGGVLMALAQGAALPPHETSLFAAAVIAGMLLGRRLSGRMAARHVQTGFAALLVTVACGLLASVMFNL